MRYVTFDVDGNLTGSFLQELQEEHIGNYIEITEEQSCEWTRYRFDGVGLSLIPLPEPTPAVPEQITPRQGYIILSRYGLLTPVKTYFAALEGQEGEEAKIELDFAQEWKRSWPTLINAAHVFGLTDAQIDQMFIEASVI